MRRCFGTLLVTDFVLEYAIKKVSENSGGLRFNSLHQEMVCRKDVNLLQQNLNTIKSKAEILQAMRKKITLGVTINETWQQTYNLTLCKQLQLNLITKTSVYATARMWCQTLWYKLILHKACFVLLC